MADLFERLVVGPDAPAVAEHFEDATADHGDREADKPARDDRLDGECDQRYAEEGDEEQVRWQRRAVGPVRPVERARIDRACQATSEPEGVVLRQTVRRDVQPGDQLRILHSCSDVLV